MEKLKISRALRRAERLLERVEQARKDLAGERSDLARTLNGANTQIEVASRAIIQACREAYPKGEAGPAVGGVDGRGRWA